MWLIERIIVFLHKDTTQMETERVQYYYGELKRYYLKTDSDWTDKAKSFRTIVHKFYNELTGQNGRFCDALKEFYRWNDQKVTGCIAFKLKDELNNIVHNNIEIDKKRLTLFYEATVRLIYIATGVFPDEATLDFIGFKPVGLLEGLNDQQKDAVLCPDKVVYVSAGPGTGKTRLLINKLLRYINVSNVKERIIALSFTNTAANELGDKFRKKIFEALIEKEFDFYNGTIHSFCFKMLKSYHLAHGKEFNYIIIDDNDINDLADEIRVQLENAYTTDEIAKCLRSYLKTRNPSLRAAVADIKKRYNIISIEDILNRFLEFLNEDGSFRLWIRPQITTLVIDEAQDLNEMNYIIFTRLMEVIPEMKLFLVGDSKQNIFGFNGGSYENLNHFLSEVGRYSEKTLTITYRCPQVVADYVNTFSFTDCPNPPLVSFSDVPGSVNIKASHSLNEEASFVLDTIRSQGSLRKSAVLCRNLKYLSIFISLLNLSHIPYKVFGGKKIVKPHVKIFNHFMRIIESDNKYSIKRIGQAFRIDTSGENFYKSYIGKRIKEIKSYATNPEVGFADIATTVVDLINCQGGDNEAADDYEKLLEISKQYSTIEDYLLAFATDKDTFGDFYQKDYAECITPVTDDFLTVSTIHSSKGLEWDNVFIMGMSDENFPNPYFARDLDKQGQSKYFNDSLKSMYVAATRTKGNLFLTYSEVNSYGYHQTPSRFLMTLNRSH